MINPSTAITETVTWVSPLWPGFTQRNKQGFYNEIVRAVFQTQNRYVDWVVAPYERALFEVATGKADITGGTGKQGGLLLSNCPVFVERMMVTCLKNNNISCDEGAKALENYKGAWYLSHMKDMKGSEKLTGKGLPPSAFLLGMLITNRVDYILSSQTVLEAQFNKLSLTNEERKERFIVQEVHSYPLFFGFSGSKRGVSIKTIYDKGWRQLDNHGELGAIYSKYNQEIPVYPGCIKRSISSVSDKVYIRPE